MRLFVFALFGLLSAPLAHADLIASPACKAARAELDAALDEAAATRARGKRLDAARSHAAAACFGMASGRAQRSGAPEPPQSVPAPRISAAPMPAPARAPLPAIAPAPPPLHIPRPTVVTTCDPAGCWDSEGRRLNQHGPLLVGPRGPCIAQGGAVTCP